MGVDFIHNGDNLVHTIILHFFQLVKIMIFFCHITYIFLKRYIFRRNLILTGTFLYLQFISFVDIKTVA